MRNISKSNCPFAVPLRFLTRCTAMNKARHRYFRFTGRTARISFIYMAAIPAVFGWVAYKTDVSGNRTVWRGRGLLERREVDKMLTDVG